MARISLARSLARSLAVVTLLLFACVEAGCSQQELAQTDIDHGPGPVVPANVVTDSTGFETATLDVDTNSLDDLKAQLTDLFTGNLKANAVIVVNPEFQSPAVQGDCFSGPGRACLVPRDQTDTDSSNNPITLFNPQADQPAVDPTIWQLPNPLTPLLLTGTGIPLPGELGTQLSNYLPDKDNVRMVVKFDPAHAYIGNRAGATGLWIPAVLETEHPESRYQHCGRGYTPDTLTDVCGTPYSSGKYPEGTVNDALVQYHCYQVDIYVKLKRIHVYLGFIPSRSSFCEWYTDDPDRAWMKNVPGGRDFRQPCLQVKAMLTATVSVTAFGHGGDAEIKAHPYDCKGVEAVCNGSDVCDGTVTGKAVPIAEDTLKGILKKTLVDADPNPVGQYFNYDKKNFPPAGCTQVGTADQAQACTTDLLRGSLDEITYGWFANPFINRSHPERHFPILDVHSSLTCPLGISPTLSDTGPAECHIGFDTVPPKADLYFDYAVDTDGDGIPNVDDNCPDDPNPQQRDIDGDGIGQDCDSCPHSDVTAANDKDGDCIADDVDNCPDTYNPDQANCNLDAEVELGIGRVDAQGNVHPRGDACDPYPCANAEPQTNALVDQFSTSCPDPSLKCTKGDWVSLGQEITWNGEQKAYAPSATGYTRFAHCNCDKAQANSWDVDTLVDKCKTSNATGLPLCTIASHASYPDSTYLAPDQSGWVSESTQTFDDCAQAGNCPIARNDAIPSTYVYNTWTAGGTAVLWRFDKDLKFLQLPGSQPINNEQDLINASGAFDGLGWAETSELDSSEFNFFDLDLDPLNTNDQPYAAKSGHPYATVSDAASHYFFQAPAIESATVYNILKGELTCPPGAACGHDLTAIVDPPCLTCARMDLGSWLLRDGNVIVEMSPGLAVDETTKLDSGLVTMLTDPSQTLVPVSEPVSLLRAQGYLARDFSVDTQTLDVTGVVAAFGGGLVGINYQFIDYDPPPTHVLTASAMQGKVYGVAGGASGEQLITLLPDIVPIGGTPPPPTIVPVTGIDADGVPLSLVYRARDAHLYLVDVEQRAWSQRLRLLRITQAGGYATVLASTPYFRAGSSVYLSATQTGDLLLAESDSPGSTLFMTLAPERDSVELTGWLVQQGSLVAPPDSRTASGVSVVMRHRPRGPIQPIHIPGSSFHRPEKPHQLPPGWQ